MVEDCGWIDDVVCLSDEVLIRRFKNDNTLINKRITFYCLTQGMQLHCPCVKNLELLPNLPDITLEYTLSQMKICHMIGGCPYVLHAVCCPENLKEIKDCLQTNLTHTFSSEDEIIQHKQRLEEAIGEGTFDQEKCVRLVPKAANQICQSARVSVYYGVSASTPVLNILSAKGRFNVIKSLVYDSFINLGFLKTEVGTFPKSSLLLLTPVHLAIEHRHTELLKFYLHLLGNAFFQFDSTKVCRMIYLFAVKKNNIAAMRLFLKRYKKLHSRPVYNELLKASLAYAFYHNIDKSVLKYLMKKGATLQISKNSANNTSPFTEMVVKDVIERVVSEGDVENFSLAIRAKLVDNNLWYTIERVVFHDNERLLHLLAQQRRGKIQAAFNSDCHLDTQAVVNNSPEMLRSILNITNLKSKQSYATQLLPRAMRYAELLGHADCCKILKCRSKKMQHELTSRYAPNVDIFKFESKHESRAKLLQRMIDNGYDVSGEHSGYLLRQALIAKDHRSVQVLLFSNLDPFPKSQFFNPRLRSEGYMLELIYCNVDLRGNPLSYLIQYQETYDRTVLNAMFVLKCIHTVSYPDKSFLQHLVLDLEMLK